jgi:hypothetical protein
MLCCVDWETHTDVSNRRGAFPTKVGWFKWNVKHLCAGVFMYLFVVGLFNMNLLLIMKVFTENYESKEMIMKEESVSNCDVLKYVAERVYFN